MLVDQILQLLDRDQQNLGDSDTSTNLVFAAKKQGLTPEFSFRHAQLHQKLISDFKSISIGAASGLSQSHLIPYSPSYRPDPYEAMYIELNSNETVKGLVESMLLIANLSLMTDDPKFYKRISFYGIVHKVNSRNWLLLRSISSKNVLKRSKRVGIFLKNGFYDRLETEVLLLDREIDCIAFENYMFIMNVNGFHRLTHYYEEVISAASDVIDTAALKIPILNLDEFKNIGTSDPRMAAKLASIKNKAYISTLTFDKVKQIIQQYNLAITIQIDTDGKDKLVFESDPSRRFLILKVLDDDYLHSNMTDCDYTVNSKY